MELAKLLETCPQATDLHATEGAPLILRVQGSLKPLKEMADADFFSALFNNFVPAAKQAAYEARHSCDVSFSAGGKRIRCHLYQADGKKAAALRLLPDISKLPADPDLPFLGKLMERTHGLVLVTGTSGSGKSTTLARLLSLANAKRACHIVTLEDPVEYLIPSQRALVHQREIGRDVPDFATGIRDALREDPDILCVGEMRDTATMDAALTAAETGHLVLATLHTTRARDAVTRLIHAFPAEREQEIRGLLADTLSAVLAQTLWRTGKETCLIREILTTLPAVQHLIREGKDEQIPSYMEMGLSGMRTMKQAVYGLKITERERERILRSL